MTSSRSIVLAHQTLLHKSPPQFVEIAAEAGFAGVTLRAKQAHPHQPLYPLLEDSPMRRETLAALHDTGLFVQDVEVLRLKEVLDRNAARQFLEAGARLGARYAGVISDDDDEARVADHLAIVAEDARSFGLGLYFEFMIYTGIKTIAQAERVIQTCGSADNINLAIDPLHLSRSGGTLQDVAAIDQSLVHYAQMCDAPAAVHPSGPAVEARDHRLLPGDGVLPLRELLQILPTGITLVVEAPCANLFDQLGGKELARRAFTQTVDLVAEADATA